MARKTLPKFFTETELEKLLASRFPATPAGLRDRAILEVLIATGLRASELLSLRWRDISPDRVFVWRGKGGRQRFVPLADRAWRALEAIRPTKVHPDSPVFRNAWGSGGLSRRGLHLIVKGYIKAAGLEGSAHTLRHGQATRLLNRGMGLRSLQVFLGHAFLGTTQVYAHLAVSKLVSEYRQVLGE